MQQGEVDPLEPDGSRDNRRTATGVPSFWAQQMQLPLQTRIAVLAGAIGLLVLAILSGTVRSTIITVIVAVAVCAGIWIGANLLFDQAQERWQRFQTLAFSVIGALLGMVLHGNALTLGSGGGFLTFLPGPILGGLALGALGYVLATIDDAQQRRMVAIGSLAILGLVIGLLIRGEYQPGVDWLAVVVYTAIVGAIGAGISVLRKRSLLSGLLVGMAFGWIVGYWGGAEVGAGNLGTAIVGSVVPALLLGVRLGESHNPDYHGRLRVGRGSRSWIFLGPGLAFIAVMLVIPAIRTAYLSLLDRDSEEFVGLENYTETFTDEASWDASRWTDMFTSYPFLIGVTILVIGAVIATRQKQLTGRAVELGNPSVVPLVAGFLFVCFGAFTAMRGTIINNLWWVVTVTFFSTAIGLAIAVLADNRGGEKVAKSIIFMPMALSLVGASIIWRFVYQTRETSKEQTGVANALWIGLGNLSTGSGIPTLIVAFLLGIAVLVSLIFIARALVRREYGRAAIPGVALLFLGWLFLRFTQIFGGGVGGFGITEEGETVAQTIVFTQESPYNNFWLMVILIWIQVGFSMVILSAAIKAVPTELIEAAKIDGATDSQVFWRVTLPQIGTTIGVVVTTVIVLVMKVFDIVKVVTNGQFDTQVLANDMFQQAFNNIDIGRGAALAMLIFLSVLPVMYFNIRRMQQEA